MKLVYIAHPYNAPTAEERAENRELAKRWVAFAAHHGFAPIATWITLTELWTERDRSLGLDIDCEIASRCDELWLCGPRVSNGMKLEHIRTMQAGRLVRRFLSFEHAHEELSAREGDLT